MIAPSALKTIQVNRPGEPRICLLDIVSWWLRSDKEATWEKLVEAVRNYEREKHKMTGTTDF